MLFVHNLYYTKYKFCTRLYYVNNYLYHHYHCVSDFFLYRYLLSKILPCENTEKILKDERWENKCEINKEYNIYSTILLEWHDLGSFIQVSLGSRFLDKLQIKVSQHKIYKTTMQKKYTNKLVILQFCVSNELLLIILMTLVSF